MCEGTKCNSRKFIPVGGRDVRSHTIIIQKRNFHALGGVWAFMEPVLVVVSLGSQRCRLTFFLVVVGPDSFEFKLDLIEIEI